jgi:hypothetical protein
MPSTTDIAWFKKTFQAEIAAATVGTPLSLDMLAALACQETGEVWPILRAAGLPTPQVLRLCVGDTLDEDRGRKAFPKNKSELISAPQGQQMFDIARAALVDMAAYVAAYAPAAARPNKFCHGFGMFQRDLQFFKTNPGFFLQKKYETFTGTLGECMKELKGALASLGLQHRTQLSDMEAASVAIFYNTGRYVPAKGLKQGYFDGKKYYGESYFDYLRLAHTVALDGTIPLIAPPLEGEAILPPLAESLATGAFLRVNTAVSTLRLRSAPEFSTPPRGNVIADLPDGHPVRAISARAVGGFRHVETTLGGNVLHGYCYSKFLERDDIHQPNSAEREHGALGDLKIIPAAIPAVPGRITRRRNPANALSLNEPGQPSRMGTTADELRAELAAIIDWLAVDAPEHERYQPHQGHTFCNIYAHDFCHLAGIYLPRVWWTARAIAELSRGGRVKPLIGNTVDEVRANDLFRWLRDYGPAFGWRQTASLTELQQTANQGGVCVIVARRVQDGKSGHIVIVVPETAENRAQRNAGGEVTSPLQSQAGARNFRYRAPRAAWWLGVEFAESAYWIHG